MVFNNSTEAHSEENSNWNNLPWYIIYACEGFLIGGGNWIIAIAILRYEALRTTKEYIIMMALAVADAINMTAYFSGGVYRTWILFSGRDGQKVTPWDCATVLHTFLWSFCNMLPNLNLVVMSLDRLFSVAKPLEYLGWSKTYAKCMVLFAYAYALCTGLPGVFLTYSKRNDQPSLAPMCFTPRVMSPENTSPLYYYHYSIAPPIFGCISVFLYVLVWLTYRSMMNSVSPEVQSQQEQINAQRRVTITLGIGCMCTFCLYVVPFSLAQLTATLDIQAPFNTFLLFFVLSNFNPLCNMFIYPLRHREMKLALKGLFTSKQMPTDIRMWRANTSASQKPIMVGQQQEDNI